MKKKERILIIIKKVEDAHYEMMKEISHSISKYNEKVKFYEEELKRVK